LRLSGTKGGQMKNRLGRGIAGSAIALASLGLAGTAIVATATPAWGPCSGSGCTSKQGTLGGSQLVAAPISVVGSVLEVSVTFSATLTALNTGNGIPDQPVVFSWNGGTCTGTTDASGVGTCSVSVLNIVGLLAPPIYNASFAGNGAYGSSITIGHVTLL
jgi:hypothetical protein